MADKAKKAEEKARKKAHQKVLDQAEKEQKQKNANVLFATTKTECVLAMMAFQ